MSDLATTLQAVAGILGAAGVVEGVRRWRGRRVTKVDLTAQVQALAMDFVRDIREDSEMARKEARAARDEARGARDEADQLHRALRLARREVDVMSAQLLLLNRAILAPDADLESLRRLARSYVPDSEDDLPSARATPSSSETTGV